MAFIISLGPWAWIIAGAILLALELAVPGAFMMWLGLAAVMVGAISFLVDWSWQWQCVAFAVLALASVPLWRRSRLSRTSSRVGGRDHGRGRAGEVPRARYRCCNHLDSTIYFSRVSAIHSQALEVR